MIKIGNKGVFSYYFNDINKTGQQKLKWNYEEQKYVYDELYKQVIKPFAENLIDKYFPEYSKYGYEKDEVIFECYIQLLKKNFFLDFNCDSSTKVSSYIYTGIKNFLIDLKRVNTKRGEENEKIYFSEIMDIDDDIDNYISLNTSENNAITHSFLLSFFKDNLENSTDSKKGLYYSHYIGYCNLSEYTVIVHKALGYTLQEIADLFDISEHKVTYIIDKSIMKIKENEGVNKVK